MHMYNAYYKATQTKPDWVEEKSDRIESNRIEFESGRVECKSNRIVFSFLPLGCNDELTHIAKTRKQKHNK